MRGLNEDLFRRVNELSIDHGYLNPIFIGLAEYTVLLAALVCLFVWFQNRSRYNRAMVVSAGVTFILAELLWKIAGLLYFNQQPFAEMSHVNLLIQKEVNNSFPSDHTIFIFSICVIFWLFHKRHMYWLIIACAVGFSRIWVGVHYPFDVLAGAAIACLTAAAVVYVPLCQKSVDALCHAMNGLNKNW